MSKLFTELDVSFYGNSDEQINTRETSMKEFSIKAPLINYCPLSVQSTLYDSNKKHVFVDDHIHSNFNINGNGAGEWSAQYKFKLPLLDINKTYVLYYELKNSINVPNDNIYIGIVPNYVVSTGGNISCGTTGITYDKQPYGDGKYKLIFKPNDEVSYLCVWRGGNHSASTFEHDLYINGIYEYDKIGVIEPSSPTKYCENLFFETTNYDSKLGEYKLSKDVHRHILQIERNIEKIQNENPFEINWR